MTLTDTSPYRFPYTYKRA